MYVLYLHTLDFQQIGNTLANDSFFLLRFGFFLWALGLRLSRFLLTNCKSGMQVPTNVKCEMRNASMHT